MLKLTNQTWLTFWGTVEQIDAAANIACEVGVSQQLHGESGDLFQLSPQKGIRRKAVKVGCLFHVRERVAR
jgi:hypothetical protein